MPENPLHQQISFAQVQQVVHLFYNKLQAHPSLSVFFRHIPDFTEHEYRISCFWWMSMGGRLEQPPRLDMISRHMPLGIRDEDLHTWLALFEQTLNEQLPADIAHQWLEKARKIGGRLKQIVIDKKPAGLQIQEP